MNKDKYRKIRRKNSNKIKLEKNKDRNKQSENCILMI